MSAASPVRVDGPRDGVLTITLDRPEKRNALNGSVIRALKEALDEARGDPDTRVVALRGAGKDFCSGADLAALEAIADADVIENLDDVDSLADLFLLLRHLEKPVVAVVHGRALAGGCGLATACDLVVAHDEASFGYPEVKIGFVPAMVMALLRRNVSEKRAFELITLGETFSASEAERIGLINRVCAAGRFEEESTALLSDLASRSTSAVRLCKRLLYGTDAADYDSAVRQGASVNVLARMTGDTRAGVRRFISGSK